MGCGQRDGHTQQQSGDAKTHLYVYTYMHIRDIFTRIYSLYSVSLNIVYIIYATYTHIYTFHTCIQDAPITACIPNLDQDGKAFHNN